MSHRHCSVVFAVRLAKNQEIHAVRPHARHHSAGAGAVRHPPVAPRGSSRVVPESPLPIRELQSQIVDALRSGNRLILSAPTGSGKSTQVPQMLLQPGLLGRGQVVILQPRRLAARLLAARVAEELGVELGREVGYQVRFENVTSAATRIKFETEGILLRQMIQDPTLRGVAARDLRRVSRTPSLRRHHPGPRAGHSGTTSSRPAHRRDVRDAGCGDAGGISSIVAPTSELSLQREVRASVTRCYGDALGLLRPPLRRPHVSGRDRIPPASARRDNPPPPWELAADAFSRFVQAGERGDVLVFMPGGFEISQTIEAIRNTSAATRLSSCCRCTANFRRAIRTPRWRATINPKSSSPPTSPRPRITIDGVRLVIDSGLARIPRYDANRGINTLLIEKISQASSRSTRRPRGPHRAGRCIRLWSRDEHDERAPQELPEIKRLDLAEVVLTLKAAGVEDLRKFRWLEAPE